MESFRTVSPIWELRRLSGSNQQAAYSIRMAMAAAREGVGRIYYMFVLDTDNFNCGWFDNGPEHDPRPVAVAMRHLNRLLRGASQLEIVSDGSKRRSRQPVRISIHYSKRTCCGRLVSDADHIQHLAGPTH